MFSVEQLVANVADEMYRNPDAPLGRPGSPFAASFKTYWDQAYLTLTAHVPEDKIYPPAFGDCQPKFPIQTGNAGVVYHEHTWPEFFLCVMWALGDPALEGGHAPLKESWAQLLEQSISVYDLKGFQDAAVHVLNEKG